MSSIVEASTKATNIAVEAKIQQQALQDLLELKCLLSSSPRRSFWKLLLPGILRITRCQAVTLSHIDRQQHQPSAKYHCYDETALCRTGEDILNAQAGRHFENCTSGSNPVIFQQEPFAQPVFPTGLGLTERKSILLSHGDPVHQSQLELLWNEGGAKDRVLSWAHVELLCQALEGMIGQQMLVEIKPRFAATVSSLRSSPPRLDQFARLIRQAGLLSHELRTPMQGIIGTLDLMHHSIEMARDAVHRADAPDFFGGLHQDIEALQESARRAAEAAENITKAWELHASRASEGAQELLNKSPDASCRPGLKRRRSDSDYDTTFRPKTRGTHSLRVPLFNPRSHRSEDVYTVVEHPQTLCPEPSRDTVYSAPCADIRPSISRMIIEVATAWGTVHIKSLEASEEAQTLEVVSRANDGSRTAKWLKWTVDQRVPANARCDGYALAHGLRPLLINALKFTKSGQILLNITIDDDDRLRLIIKENGCGIPQDRRAAIFESFSQADNSISRTTEGLGLGLTLARDAARKAGGDVVLVRSSIEGHDKGSTFALTLPFEHDDRPSMLPSPPTTASPFRELEPIWEQPTRETTPASPAQAKQTPFGPDTVSSVVADWRPSSVSRKKSTRHSSRSSVDLDTNLATACPLNILVAEDNAINRRLLNSMLVRLGYSNAQIKLADDGNEAVNLAEASLAHKPASGDEPPHQPFDLILMDLWMPQKDGYTAAREILQLYDHLDYPATKPSVIAVTADATGDTATKVLETGMEGMLLKPFGVKKLERLLRSVCEGRNIEGAEYAAQEGERPEGSQSMPTATGAVEVAAAG